MRYFHYQSNKSMSELETKAEKRSYKMNRYGELIIDDDTVYEIDRDCIRCKEKKSR
ncbi:MAG: hypothetical protein LUH14_02050 [Clostridiaceae bacterium]|nr:hypothetical protein [Clostridiaceae bacterium]